MSKVDKFITKARIKHGDKYNYDKVMFNTQQEDVIIGCPFHGEFKQAVNNHLRGKGCSKCGHERTARSKTTTQDEFISKCKAKHGDKYDYSQTIYTKAAHIITIICRKHGPFEQTANSHLNGHGCKLCGLEVSADKQRYTNEEFIEKSRSIHGNKFDYSKSEYKGNDVHVIIICPIHGAFSQTPASHWAHDGCKKCSWEKLSHEQKIPQDEFISRCVKKHGDKYDYKDTIYNGNNYDITIFCNKCKQYFTQNANCHVNAGQGCPRCMNETNSKGEEMIEKILIKYNIPHQKQAILEINRSRRYDFYFNGILIEYDGIQHFYCNEQFHPLGPSQFAERQMVDIEKTINAIIMGYCIIRLDFKLKKQELIEQHLNLACDLIKQGCRLYLSSANLYAGHLAGALKQIPNIRYFALSDDKPVVNLETFTKPKAKTDKKTLPITKDTKIPDTTWNREDMRKFCRTYSITYAGKRKDELFKHIIDTVNVRLKEL